MRTSIFEKPVFLRLIILGAFLLVGAGLALTGYSLSRRITLSQMGMTTGADPQFVEGQPVTAPGETPAAGVAITPTMPTAAPSDKPWDGVNRVTILLLGLDYRDWTSGEKYWRSDTMILVTLDPLSKSIGILSIPRDLWVEVPGFGHGKINTAYFLGDANKYPGGGPALAVKTVESVLGVPINYFAQVDFSTFVKFIDEIGGVKINVPAPITIDMLGAGSATKKKLPAGVQVLPGEWALAYARARYTEGGDFDRADRQQQVILAIRDQILNFNQMPTLAAKAPQLYGELSSGVRTNLGLEEMVQLGLLAAQVPSENIRRGVIGKAYVLFGESAEQGSILIPLPDKIMELRDQVFAEGGVLGPLTPGDTAGRLPAEAARVLIRDATGGSGLAERLAEKLRGLGVNVTGVVAADTVRSSSSLVLHNSTPFALSYLSELLKTPSARIRLEYDLTNPADVDVILGRDWAGE